LNPEDFENQERGQIYIADPINGPTKWTGLVQICIQIGMLALLLQRYHDRSKERLLRRKSHAAF
jgi:hypothetical protein